MPIISINVPASRSSSSSSSSWYNESAAYVKLEPGKPAEAKIVRGYGGGATAGFGRETDGRLLVVGVPSRIVFDDGKGILHAVHMTNGDIQAKLTGGLASARQTGVNAWGPRVTLQLVNRDEIDYAKPQVAIGDQIFNVYYRQSVAVGAARRRAT